MKRYILRIYLQLPLQSLPTLAAGLVTALGRGGPLPLPFARVGG